MRAMRAVSFLGPEEGKSAAGVTGTGAGGGSGTGIAALINGTTQICEASRPMKAEEKKSVKDQRHADAVEIPVALDALAVYQRRPMLARATLGQIAVSRASAFPLIRRVRELMRRGIEPVGTPRGGVRRVDLKCDRHFADAAARRPYLSGNAKQGAAVYKPPSFFSCSRGRRPRPFRSDALSLPGSAPPATA